MNQRERLDYLIKVLCKDSIQYADMKVEAHQKRMLMQSLMNIRMPKPISAEFTRIQDEFLQQEATDKGIISWKDIPHIGEQFITKYEYADKISLWQGDITTLKVDAIVNAANSQMLGCFVPGHKCIDNAIHSAAGIQLREECNHYMKVKRSKEPYYEEPTGSAVVTKGYNLPCDYIIHTVGPIMQSQLTEDLKNDLYNCYKACLQEAINHGIRTIAFCCISTGEFHFPNDEAARIAWTIIKDAVEQNLEKFDRIIINVYKDCDLEIYQKLLSDDEY
jgi:O-acetyl-ADP-ribose deacetylase (regulator of RNase III)